MIGNVTRTANSRYARLLIAAGCLSLAGCALPSETGARPETTVHQPPGHTPAPSPDVEPGPPPRDAANAAFWWRIDNPPPDPLQPPYSWYRPLARLPGRPQSFLPHAGDRKTIASTALAAAERIAAEADSDALLIVHRGKVQLERYYRGDATTRFSSHSLAKTLNALAIGVAIRLGHISNVDEPASRWLHEWPDSSRAEIRLRDLLTMSGGFDTPQSTDPGSRFVQVYYGADIGELVRHAAPSAPPGTRYAYDNYNNHALGLVIERTTRQSYLDFLSRHIWQPIGADDAEMLLDRPGGRAYANCCLWATPRDWLRVGLLLLDDGRWRGNRVLPAGWVDQMTTQSAANRHFGFQVFLGSAWLDPKVNRRMARLQGTLAPAATERLFYLIGAGDLQLMVVPDARLVFLRVGKGSASWRDHRLVNALLAGISDPISP